MDWTAVCLAADLPEKLVIAAECAGAGIAVWRSATGQLAAWADRCPHRGMRLSHGFVRGETLNCIYHGWTYGTDGGCTRIPAHPDLVPPASIKVVRFDIVQAQGLVWVAPLGASAALPDLAGLIPVRSLVIEGAAQQLAEALPEFTPHQGLVWRGGYGGLVVQPIGDTRCRVHLLVRDLADKVPASRWAEALRQTVEIGVNA